MKLTKAQRAAHAKFVREFIEAHREKLKKQKRI